MFDIQFLAYNQSNTIELDILYVLTSQTCTALDCLPLQCIGFFKFCNIASMSPIEMGLLTGVIMGSIFHCIVYNKWCLSYRVSIDLRGSCDSERMSPLRRLTTIQFHDIGYCNICMYM